MMIAGASQRALATDRKESWISWRRKANSAPAIVDMSSRHFMEALAKEDGWFEDLFGPCPQGQSIDYRHLCSKATSTERVRRFMTQGTISAGIPLRVVELTGAPGDIIIWDPRCLHSASNNVSSRPRSVIKFRLDRTQPKRGSAA